MSEFISEILNNGQVNVVLIAPVLFVCVGVILVYAFGFKKPTEAQFKKFAAADSVKRAKRKDKSQKSTQNGVLVTSQEKGRDNKRKEAGQHSQQKSASNVAVSNAGKRDKISGGKKDVSPTNMSGEGKSVTATLLTKKQTLPKKTKSESKTIPAVENDGEWMVVTKERKKKSEQMVSSKLPQKSVKTNKGAKKEQVNKVIKEQANKATKEDSNAIENTVNYPPSANGEAVKSTNDAPTPPPVLDTPKAELKPSTDENAKAKNDALFANDNNVLFDELGDAWTEAKAPRKTKKRARKE